MDLNGLSIYEVARLIKRKSGKYVAIALKELEEILGEDEITCPNCGERITTEYFQRVRKLMLDMINDYTRGIWYVFGIEIEGTHIYD